MGQRRIENDGLDNEKFSNVSTLQSSEFYSHQVLEHQRQWYFFNPLHSQFWDQTPQLSEGMEGKERDPQGLVHAPMFEILKIA